MAERTSGPWSLLTRPWVYEALQTLLGADRSRQDFTERHLHPRLGERVLDIGCGTARLARYLGPVTYVGFDPNAEYVARGQAENSGRDVTLHTGYFDAAAATQHAPFDLVIVSAVLHHMDDRQANELFMLLARVTKPTGRVVTLDNVYVPDQSPVARFIISMDRGRSVRSPEGYAALARAHFGDCQGVVQHRAWVPYTFWIMNCRHPKP
jgi:SAM-dependent methyltransferase